MAGGGGVRCALASTMLHSHAILAGALSLALVSCAADLEDEPDVERDDQALTNSPRTTLAPEVVRLRLNDGSGNPTSCTGVAITQHIVITAAHCLDGQPEHGDNRVQISYYANENSGGRRVYPDGTGFGRASYYRHPQYDSGPIVHHDFAFIRLYDGGMSVFAPAPLYVDAREPWDEGSAEPHRVVVFGTGKGSEVGESSDCDDATSTGYKRRGGRFWLDRDGGNGLDQKMQVSMSDGQDLCPGDSGGAWTLRRGGMFMTFALSSYRTPDWYYGHAYGAGTRRHWQWLQDRAAGVGAPIRCPRTEASDGYLYMTCYDL